MNTWQVGLDIQEDSFCALAVQRRRYGWQLRHWYYQAVSSSSIGDKTAMLSPEIMTALSEWRRNLPRRVSLRIALPADVILQQSIKLPEPSLSLQEQTWLVEASMSKLFPLAARELAVDYRLISPVNSEQSDSGEIIVSATRKWVIEHWKTELARANIFPDIIDATPCVLRYMALSGGVPPDSLLVHQMYEKYLLVSPLNHPFYYQVIPDNSMTVLERIEYARQTYQQISDYAVDRVSYSGFPSPDIFPSHIQCWSPLVALQQMQPPLPDTPQQFVLACGLALRSEDC
ncbi:pilus assembly protein PilM [Budviciaceae bacterium BWR-B9]|uniref:Pilus assembly protein PilM n=1 Tax=Limnobaculum allomyrinae TaxID=2791986 RepID=A0ABS1IQN6_9GAMM|nr:MULTISPECIES: pilus assembly protein PilM [Limnobaculum]MBK5144067.1 pilus assembly protein PilM [Limnobaculum allomyrinae]MBV7691726.1 pilus assembly protein PilM [Limnobaculum sp. M2-1]